MNVAVVGCGSLGGVIAVRLAGRQGILQRQRQPLHLEVLNRNPLIAEAASLRGLRLRLRAGGRWRTARVPLAAAPLHPPYDAIILAQKAGGIGLEQTCRELLPALSPRGFFITTQNGLAGLELLRTFGPARVVPGCVLWGASMTAPGVYELTAAGPFLLQSGEVPPLAEARALLSQVFPVRPCPDIAAALWSKLAISASFTALGAISGLRFGRLAAAPASRRMILAIGEEVLGAARAQGVELGSLGGGLDVGRFLRPAGQGGYRRFGKHLLLRLMGWKNRRTESSMLDSLRRGRPTEIDFLNGLVVRTAGQAGLPAPWNRAVCQLVGEMERGLREPGQSNLAELGRRAAALQAGGGYAR
jgi:2-dehydropantoate 2-reductase